jgi:hypothetical protein
LEVIKPRHWPLGLVAGLFWWRAGVIFAQNPPGMIQKLTVHKLWGRENFALEFHPDLNIFTGSNGSGKTTLLKLLWYLPL